MHKEEEERDIKARLVKEVEERGMRQASTRPAKGRQTVEGEMKTNVNNQMFCKHLLMSSLYFVIHVLLQAACL